MSGNDYGFIGSNLGLEYPTFEDALKKKGITYQERAISQALGLYELTYEHDGQRHYAYIRSVQYDVDGFGQDVFVFSKPIPDERVPLIAEILSSHE
jgi:hypothetical protein